MYTEDKNSVQAKYRFVTANGLGTYRYHWDKKG